MPGYRVPRYRGGVNALTAPGQCALSGGLCSGSNVELDSRARCCRVSRPRCYRANTTIIPHAGTIWPCAGRCRMTTPRAANAAWGMSNVYQSTLFWYARPGGRKPAARRNCRGSLFQGLQSWRTELQSTGPARVFPQRLQEGPGQGRGLRVPAFFFFGHGPRWKG